MLHVSGLETFYGASQALFGMTLSVHPGEFGIEPSGLNAIISGGVVYSFSGQKGQNPPFFLCD